MSALILEAKAASTTPPTCLVRNTSMYVTWKWKPVDSVFENCTKMSSCTTLDFCSYGCEIQEFFDCSTLRERCVTLWWSVVWPSRKYVGHMYTPIEITVINRLLADVDNTPVLRVPRGKVFNWVWSASSKCQHNGRVTLRLLKLTIMAAKLLGACAYTAKLWAFGLHPYSLCNILLPGKLPDCVGHCCKLACIVMSVNKILR